MITLDQYFSGRPHTNQQSANAVDLLYRVNELLNMYMKETGEEVEVNMRTGSYISGVTEGGFRLQDCQQGAPLSSHKQGQGVDITDPYNHIDDWLTDFKLELCGLYREHPESTEKWCHLTTRAPASGHRTFRP
jgi:hypothetical protein